MWGQDLRTFPQKAKKQNPYICYHLLCRCMEYDFNHKISLRECHNLKLLIKAMRYSWSEQLQNLLFGMRLSVRLFGCRDMAVSMSLLLQKISHILLRPILTSWPSIILPNMAYCATESRACRGHSWLQEEVWPALDLVSSLVHPLLRIPGSMLPLALPSLLGAG